MRYDPPRLPGSGCRAPEDRRAMAVTETACAPARPTPLAQGRPLVGHVLELAKDPARFFAQAYRDNGPVFRIKLFNKPHPVIAGADAANFMGSREGRECLRSKEF